MKTNRKAIVIPIIIGATVLILISSSSSAQRSFSYEVQPQVDIPVFGGANEAILESYERIIHHFMEQNERSNLRLSDQLNQVIEKLETVASKLDDLDTRITEIEVALDIINQPQIPINSPTSTESESETPQH